MKWCADDVDSPRMLDFPHAFCGRRQAFFPTGRSARRMRAPVTPPGDPTSLERKSETAAQGFLRFALTIFIPFVLGQFFSFYVRTINAVIAPELMTDVGLKAPDLGLLTAVFFLTSASMQLPLGIMLDRFGPRRVQPALFCVAAIGTLLFSFGQGRYTLAFGRAVIGLGVSCSLMSGFRAIMLWLPRHRWPLANSCLLAGGSLGVFAATAPTRALLHYMSWRGIFLLMTVAALVIAGLIFNLVPEKPGSRDVRPLREQWRGLAAVYTDPLFHRLAPTICLATGTYMAVQGLWAGLWFRDVGGYNLQVVATHLFALAVALTIGYLTMGVIADRLTHFGIKLIDVLCGGALLFYTVELLLTLGVDAAGYLPWILFGLLSASLSLAFPVLGQHFPVEFGGRSTTALNVLIFFSAFAAQSLIGVVVGWWPPDAAGRYPAIAYAWALGLMLAAQALAFVRLLRWRLSHGRTQAT